MRLPELGAGGAHDLERVLDAGGGEVAHAMHQRQLELAHAEGHDPLPMIPHGGILDTLCEGVPGSLVGESFIRFE
ncbi:hypothetical protein ACFYUK_04990 [Nonomuraea wenchangensis]